MAISAARHIGGLPRVTSLKGTGYRNLDTTRTVRTYSHDVLVACNSPNTASRISQLFNPEQFDYEISHWFFYISSKNPEESCFDASKRIEDILKQSPILREVPEMNFSYNEKIFVQDPGGGPRSVVVPLRDGDYFFQNNGELYVERVP